MKKLIQKMVYAALATLVMFTILQATSLDAQAADTFNYKGHTYKVYNVSKTWTKSNKFCKNEGCHLVTITSKGEQEFINTKVLKNAKKKCYWIGLNWSEKKHGWTWVTGEKYDFKNWAPNEPNDYNNHKEPYVHLFGIKKTSSYGKDVGTWNDCKDDGAAYADSFYQLQNYGFIVEWDGAPVKTPAITKVVNKTGKITGTTTANAKVYITLKQSKRTIKYETKANNKGTFSIKTVALKKGDKISIYAKKKNVKSKVVNYTVK